MKEITKYLKKRKEAIILLLEKPKRKYTADTFHKLRVELKKLDAFFELINFCIKDFKREKTFESFKLIFDQAGKVREVQVEESILKKYFFFNMLKAYRASLKKLRLQEQKEYFSLVNKKLVEKLKNVYREIIPVLAEVNKKKVNQYMEVERKKIETLLGQNSLKVPQAHELRKELKMFSNNRTSLNLEQEYKPLPKEDILPDLLGQWHDSQVIIKNLKKEMETEGITLKEANQIEKIKAKMSSKNEVLFKKINKAVAAS